MRSSLLLLIAFLVLPLSACGDKSGSEYGAEGAATPEELIERMQELSESHDFAALVPLVIPQQRAVLTFGVGIALPTLMIGASEMMLPMAAAGGPEAAKSAKAKVEALKTRFETILKKYKIEADQTSVMTEGPALRQDPEAAIEAMNKRYGHVDHAAFIKESMAFMDSHSDKDGEKSSEFPSGFDDLQIDGDKGTVKATHKGKDGRLGLVKQDGRWYVDFLSMMNSK